MYDGSAADRRALELFRRSRTTSVIKSFWQTQLRSASALDSPCRDRTPSTQGSSSAGGLTESSGSAARGARVASCAASSSTRRALHKAALTAERHRADEIRERYGTLAKPLFQSYLLPQLEAHETCPALTVVFDLDETLVSNRDANLSAAILRPYSLHVLNALRHMKGIEVVLWTASTKTTGSPVVEQLSVSGPVFDEVVYRSDLWFTEPLHTKDLRLLGRDLDRLIIIDNAANCCKLNPQNAVLVDGFHGFRGGDDAALVNVYYIIERVLKACHQDMPVPETLRQIAEDGQLCRHILFSLPEAWKSLPLREIAPLKIPPHGRFTLASSEPLDRSVMRYWTT